MDGSIHKRVSNCQPALRPSASPSCWSSRILAGGVPRSMSHATREANVIVFPVPAPATTRTGPPSHVEIAFDKRVAPYIRARVWHPSQSLRDAADGGVVLTLDVCNDLALRSWILGWSPSARVLAPAALAADIRTDLMNATAQYQV